MIGSRLAARLPREYDRQLARFADELAADPVAFAARRAQLQAALRAERFVPPAPPADPKR